jgi:hypothetical protein
LSIAPTTLESLHHHHHENQPAIQASDSYEKANRIRLTTV